MNTLIITYDLNKKGQNYTSLLEAIRKYYPRNCHPMKSVFFIKTTNNASEVFDLIVKFVDSNDDLFVGRIDGWKGRLLPENALDFLKS